MITNNHSTLATSIKRADIVGDKSALNEKIALAVLATLLCTAFLLRLYRLNGGLWLDEIITYLKYARLPFGEIITTYESENQHFLYSLLAHASLLIFGDSAWALRLPAALFGVGSIWAVYLVGKEVGNRREALLSAALLTFSYHHLWFSQNARGYSGLLFWALLSSWFLLRALRDNRSRLWIFYSLSSTLGIYTHMTMAFVVVGQFLVFLIESMRGFLQSRKNRPDVQHSGKQSIIKDLPRIWSALLLGFGLTGLFTLLLHFPVLSAITGTVGGSEKSVVTAWKSPLWTVLEIIRGLNIGFGVGIVGAGALVLFVAGMIGYLRTRPAILGLLLFPPVIGAAITIAVGHHLWPRFFFFALGFAALVLVRGIFVFSEWIFIRVREASIHSTLLGTALCAALILMSAISLPAAYGPKQDYEGAYRFVEANMKPGDQVVTVDLAAMIYRDYIHTDWQEVDSLGALDTIRKQAKNTWLIYTFPPVMESIYPDIMDSIQHDFILVQEFPGTVSEGTVYVYRADGNPASLISREWMTIK